MAACEVLVSRRAQLIRDYDLRAQADLSNRIRLMLPVQSCPQKYFASPPTQIKSIFARSRPTEGRLAIVTDAGRDAVDADGASDEGA